MNDELDALSDTWLSLVFAKEVAGYYPQARKTGGRPRLSPPLFAARADAVMPWLDKAHWEASTLNSGLYIKTSKASASAPTFARAACIALIRSARASEV